MILNGVIREPAAHFREALGNPAFREAMGSRPPGVRVTPHPFHQVAIPYFPVG